MNRAFHLLSAPPIRKEEDGFLSWWPWHKNTIALPVQLQLGKRWCSFTHAALASSVSLL